MAQFVLVPRSVLRSVLLPVQRMTRAFPRPRHRDQRTAGTINAEQATALQGFALLLALGDEAAATRASHAALRAGAGGRDALDARLRHRALRALDPAWGQVPRLLRGRPLLDPERRAALRQLGVNDIGLEGLASMAPAERAALIASAAEGMDEAGVARVVGLHARFSRVLLGRARRRYLATTSAFLDENPWARREIGGPLARRIRRAAGRARGAEAAAVGDHASCWAWLAGGAGGRPSAPMSVHATACQACAKAIVALDALHAIDTSRADGPAPLPAPAGWWWNWARYLAAPALVVLVAVSGIVQPTTLSEGLLGLTSGLPGSQGNERFGLGSLFGDPDATPAPTEGATPTGEPGATPGAPISGPDGGPIPQELPPVPGAPTLIPGIPSPSSSLPSAPGSSPGSTPPPSSAPPSPGASPPPPTPPPPPPPTPEPTEQPTPPPPPPTPEPTPEPTPQAVGECQDGQDNDGDLLVDLADPGCLLGLRDSESLL